jgi:hypothetical protein
VQLRTENYVERVNNMNIFEQMQQLRKASEVVAKIEMTPAEVKALSKILKDGGRVNVWPNKFDTLVPLRVSVKRKDKYTNHGYFTSVDVAAAVGTICGIAAYGAKALKGEFDQELVEGHEEWHRWLADERNESVLKEVGML